MAILTINRIVNSKILLQGQGGTGVNFKDATGVATFRNTADSAYADVALKNLRIQGANTTFYVGLDVPGSLAANTVFVLPALDGAANQVLKTDGSKNLGWATVNLFSDQVRAIHADYANGTATTNLLVAPPANCYLKEIWLIPAVASGTSAGQISVGVSGTVAAYAATTDSDLTSSEVQIIPVGKKLGGSPADIILTITAGGQTFSGTAILFYFNAS